MSESETGNFSLDDEKIIVERSKKDPAAFRPIYEMFFEDIFRFAYHRTGEKNIAGDITSNVFYKALTKIKSFTHRENSIKAWLLTIAFNEINLYFRERKREKTIMLEDDSLKAIADDYEFDVLEYTPALINGLNQLSDEEIEMIEMKYYEKLKHEEIAEILHISASNAKVKLHRAIKKLKTYVNEPVKK
ncbi:sigma-70 family RNA polymerase sigma factor [bacterium]|nr:sigma-70 family RNA polymerase sigma factor [bacterium]